MKAFQSLPMCFLLFSPHLSHAGDDPPTTQPSAAMIQPCLAAAADYSPVYPAEAFPPLREIAAVFRLGPDEAFDKLTAVWIAVDVGDAAPANYEIARGDLVLKDQSSGVLRLTGLHHPMPVGKYRLDVLAEGELWKSADFSIIEPAEAVELRSPGELLPLEPGTTWSYSFLQEAGPGARISLPGTELDEDGKLRAEVSMRVTGREEAGAHVELRRSGQLVSAEWWTLDRSGLSATRRQTQDELIQLDPPQVLVSWPLEGPREWQYQSKNDGFEQKYRMWGPVPIRGPWGESAGYVILTEQATAPAATTVERHFVPGIGFVREILLTALAGKRVSRQEMVLKEKPSASSSN